MNRKKVINEIIFAGVLYMCLLIGVIVGTVIYNVVGVLL